MRLISFSRHRMRAKTETGDDDARIEADGDAAEMLAAYI